MYNPIVSPIEVYNMPVQLSGYIMLNDLYQIILDTLSQKFQLSTVHHNPLSDMVSFLIERSSDDQYLIHAILSKSKMMFRRSDDLKILMSYETLDVDKLESIINDFRK